MPADTAAPIECPVTKWYYGRLLKLGAMLLVFAAWFYKDGAWSWPKENIMAVERERYALEITEPFEKARASGQIEAWRAEAKAKGWKLNDNGEPLSWAVHAAAKGWPEKPKKRPPTEIRQQFYWSGAMAVGVVAVGVAALLNRGRKLRGFHDHFILPNGRRVNHADAFRIDKRPWQVKGLAQVFYRVGGEGPARKAVIDDLKYAGAGQVLDQLLANFHGELIDKQSDPEDSAGGSENAAS